MSENTSEPARPRGRPRVKNTPNDLTRLSLIEAAVAVFSDKGYTHTTIEQIVEAAGCSRATFYLHFRSKADFLPILLEQARHPFDELYQQLPKVLQARDQSAFAAWIVQSMTRWDEVAKFIRPVYEAADSDIAAFNQLFPEELPGIREFEVALEQSFPLLDQERLCIIAAVIAAPLLHFFRRHLRGTRFDPVMTAATISRSWISTIENLS